MLNSCPKLVGTPGTYSFFVVLFYMLSQHIIEGKLFLAITTIKRLKRNQELLILLQCKSKRRKILQNCPDPNACHANDANTYYV